MKLDKTQISAIANRIAREINAVRQQQYNAALVEKMKELQNKIDHDFTVIKAALVNFPIKTRIQVLIDVPKDQYYVSEGHKITQYEASRFLTLDTVSADRIKEDIIIEQIEDHQTLESLINTIKNKYVTN